MTVSLEMKLAALAPRRRRKVEARAAELIREGELRKARKERSQRLRDKPHDGGSSS
jgi:hypothetical protein